jgi:hypothetical protein
MAIEISESTSAERFKTSLANILEAVEFDIDSLPEPWREAFEGPLKLVAGSKISLGIIGEKQVLPIIRFIDLIRTQLLYPDFINYDLQYISSETAFLGGIINVGMAKDGKFLLEGPMSKQFIRQTQELIEPNIIRRRVKR